MEHILFTSGAVGKVDPVSDSVQKKGKANEYY